MTPTNGSKRHRRRPTRSSLPSLWVEDALTGIVSFTMQVESERSDPDVFVVTAQTANVTAYGLPNKVASNGNAAGLTYQAAYGAAVGECVERYAPSINHPEDLLFSSYTELREQGLNPIAPHGWALFDPSQFGQIHFLPFREDTRTGWLRAESLTHRQDCLVPACFVLMPYSMPFKDQGETMQAPAFSTGLACARARVDALIKGICEIVERDAFMIMWRNRLPCPRVQIDPQSELYALYMEKFARPGLIYTLMQTTLDLAIPSFFGTLLDTRCDPPSVCVGGAAHPDPNQAMLKTLIEMAQGLQWVRNMDQRSFPREPGFRNVRSFEDRVRLYAFNDMREAFQFLWDNPEEVPLSAIPSLDAKDPHRTLHRCIQVLAEQELEVIGVDLTPVDVLECGLYVTKVLIPECEVLEGSHRTPFLGGRRWREVPYRLGRRAAIATLDSVNPYPHPYP